VENQLAYFGTTSRSAKNWLHKGVMCGSMGLTLPYLAVVRLVLLVIEICQNQPNVDPEFLWRLFWGYNPKLSPLATGLVLCPEVFPVFGIRFLLVLGEFICWIPFNPLQKLQQAGMIITESTLSGSSFLRRIETSNPSRSG